jgi:hypothetical protein
VSELGWGEDVYANNKLSVSNEPVARDEDSSEAYDVDVVSRSENGRHDWNVDDCMTELR